MPTPTHHWYFLPSPLLGPSSWKGVAEVLEALGHTTLVADPPMTTTADSDHLAPWVDAIVKPGPPAGGPPVAVVGHSAACPRMPFVTYRLIEAGWDVTTMVCVDGRYPDGQAFTSSQSHYAELLDGLVRPDDYLPPWPRWWGSLVEGLVVDPAARDQVFREARPVPRSWFDQPCPVPDLPPTVRRGFLSFGPGYEVSCDRAHEAGWLTYRLNGDHLHQVVAPGPVGSTLLAMLDCLHAGS